MPEEKEEKEVIVWNKEAIKKYSEETAERCSKEMVENKETENIEEKWEMGKNQKNRARLLDQKEDKR